MFLLFAHWNEVHIGEVSDVCKGIELVRECKD